MGVTSCRIMGSSPAISCTRPAKPARAGRAELDPALARDRPHHVLDGPNLVEHGTPRHQQRTAKPGRIQLDVNLPVTARRHDLGERAGIVSVGLVGHRHHGRVGGPRFDADRWQIRCTKFVVQPDRQRACLQAKAFQRQAEPRQGDDEGGRLAGRTHLLDDPTRLVDEANRGLFQGPARAGFHASSLAMASPAKRAAVRD